jgi:hypothetical protein
MRSASPGFSLLALLGMVAVLASGCGGGGKSSSVAATTTPTTKTPTAKTATTDTPTTETAATATARGGQYSDYELKMQVLGDRLARVLARTGRDIALPGVKPALLERDLLTAQTQIRAAAVGLEHIKPPPEIEAKHKRLVTAVREFAAELDGVIAGLKEQNGAPLTAVIPQLKGVRDMAKASDAITKAGYAIVVQPK